VRVGVGEIRAVVRISRVCDVREKGYAEIAVELQAHTR
jgi:hypothetical protein